MANSSDIFRREATLISRVYCKLKGPLTVNAASGALYGRATALGCGGQGANWGGGGALARSRFPVQTDGEAFNIQVGDVSTASPLGDSWVKRLDGTILVSADRGRGNGTGGRAANSIGDIKLDGQNGTSGTPSYGGNPASDEALFGSVGIGGFGVFAPGAFLSGILQADPGGGGLLSYIINDSGEINGTIAYPAGGGLVVFEWFNFDPGY